METGSAADRPNCIAAIRAALNSLGPSEAQVAQVILRSPARSVRLSIGQLAAEAGVSEATVVRFCKSTGFEGYRDFKISLATQLTDRLLLADDLTPDDDIPTLSQKVFDNGIAALAATQAGMDPAVLTGAIEAIENATHIEFFGIGSSYPIAWDGYYRLMRLGLPVAFGGDIRVQVLSSALIVRAERPVAIVVSHSGETKQMVAVMEEAVKAGATGICITSFAHSTLAQLATFNLVALPVDTVFQHEALGSRIAHLATIDAIFAALVLRNRDRLLPNLRIASDVLERRH